MDKILNDELNGNNVCEKKVSDSLKESCGLLAGELNLENIKFNTVCGGSKNTLESSEAFQNKFEYEKYATDRKNNNHHVVPFGVLIVLVTIYLGLSSIPKCFVNCSENEMPIMKKSVKVSIPQADPRLKDSQILERLLEYKDICNDLEVFTDINTTHDVKENIKKKGKKQVGFPLEAEVKSDNGSGDCAKTSSKKKKKSKFSIKLPINAKNGFHKNKSYTNKVKYTNQHEKKDPHLNKKNSTAEPIIYLFALVFVYLLLKAASDINQHYKSQTKNDKRLRRCSLQSYAQTHRTDRRSSKELALKQKQQRLMASSRSSSIEQQQLQQSPLRGFFLSENNTNTSPTTQPSQIKRTTTSSNWQLLRQHMTHSSVDTLSPPSAIKAEFSSTVNRRCSVPVLPNYQRQTHKNSAINLGGILTDPLVNRRTSITMPLDAIDPMAIETKRRVRMINRH